MAGRRKTTDAPLTPGWYPDPWSATGIGERYFDGKRWGSTERPRSGHSTVERKQRARTRDDGSRRFPRARVVVAVLFIVGAALVVSQLQQGGSDSGSSASALTDRPPPSREEAAKPLGAPAPVPTGTGQYEMLANQRDHPKTPIAFDPCRPIHYVVNSEGAPSDGMKLIHDAVARVETATGLHFIDDGATTEAPDKNRPPYQPKRYDDSRWAPVLVAWSDETSFPSLAGYIAGIGGAQAVAGSDGRFMYATGLVVLDRDQMSESALPDRGEARAIVLHEFGHLVGLDHTSDRNQIMFSEGQFNVRDYGDGDLRGLARLGTQACFPGL
jgi:hypothetical protein